MSDYTPTTANIRSGYASCAPNRDVVTLALGFDRWLAAHDAEIRANNPTGDVAQLERELDERTKQRDSLFDQAWAYLNRAEAAEKKLSEQAKRG